MQTITPNWITKYLWGITFLTSLLTVICYIKPDIFFMSWKIASQIGAFSLVGPMGLFLSRNIAIVIMSIFALSNNSIVVLQATFVARVVASGIDFVHNILSGNIFVASFTFTLFIVELIILIKLDRIWKIASKKD